MKRRDFLAASALAVTVPLSKQAMAADGDAGAKKYLELRQYEFASAAKQEAFEGFLSKAAIPALNRQGIKPVGVFKAAKGDDTSLWVLIGHDSLESAIKFVKCNDVACDGEDEAISILDSLAASQKLSLVIDDYGLPVVAYAALRVVRCNDDACSGDDETIVNVDNYGLGGSTSIMIGDDGLPMINYSSPELRIVHCGTVSCQ